MPLDVRRTPPEAVSEMMFLLSDALGHASAADAQVLEKFRKKFLKFQQEFNKRRSKPVQESPGKGSAKSPELATPGPRSLPTPALSFEQLGAYLAAGGKAVEDFGQPDDDSEETTEASEPV
jgi:hypothetical protein